MRTAVPSLAAAVLVSLLAGGCDFHHLSPVALADQPPVAETSGGSMSPDRKPNSADAGSASASAASVRAVIAGTVSTQATDDAEFGLPSDLPRPSTMSTEQFESHLFPFLRSRQYAALGWRRDKAIRDTGPFLDGVSYGTHPAVRVYYSPGIMRWLVAGRVGTIPDGEMIIKEQFAPPAAQHQDKDEAAILQSLESWTVMIKDSQGSHDGWFWSNPSADAQVIDYRAQNEHPVSGFGLYCVRCHASTESPGVDAPDALANEFTFAALRNIEGFPGQPILFRVDDSWRATIDAAEPGRDPSSDTPGDTADVAPADDASDQTGDAAAAAGKETSTSRVAPNADFLSLYDSIGRQDPAAIVPLPPSSYDSVPADNTHTFATSDQCMSCHAGLTGPLGPVGFVFTGKEKTYGAPGINVSPYGQWRWTPMGLAGRDPIFLAQLESEIAMIRDQFGGDAEAQQLTRATVDACLRCHGAMGHHEFHRQQGAAAKLSHDVLAMTDASSDDQPAVPSAAATKDRPTKGHATKGHATKGHPTNGHATKGHATHGALARDGISCMVCHRMQPRPQPADDQRPYLQHFLETSITGNLYFGPPGEIYGPYKDDALAAYAMQHATGLRPRHSDYIQKSQLCGSCHTVTLPTIDRPLGPQPDETDLTLGAGETVPEFKPFRHHVEQATYLEWLNSQYNDELDSANPKGRSCQACHMADQIFADESSELAGPIRTRIAAIQDDTYPDAENLADHTSLRVRVRDRYRRHDFAGLNVGLLQLFSQFDDVLGVKRTDYMTGSDSGAQQAIASMVRTASEQTATLTVHTRLLDSSDASQPSALEAVVHVRNLAGHRFPSGVGFRRAFLELQVVRATGDGEKMLWASGRTNAQGVIVDGQNQPLPTEFFSDEQDDQPFQPHHRLITSEGQVQIYETLLKDNRGRLTTSFVRGCETVKDNRLLPQGWTAEGPGGGLTGAYLKATHPGPQASTDPDFVDGTGSDRTVYRVPLPNDVDPRQLRVRATLYYQATPPYYLQNLFTTAPDGEATKRLHALASRLQLRGTPLENWKLKIASASAAVAGGPQRLVETAAR